jgi:hypothetical protein
VHQIGITVRVLAVCQLARQLQIAAGGGQEAQRFTAGYTTMIES